MCVKLPHELRKTAIQTHRILQTGLVGTPHAEQIFEQFSQQILWPQTAHKDKNAEKVYETINED